MRGTARPDGCATAVGLAVGVFASVSTAAAAAPQWIYVVFKGSGSGFASNVTAGGGRLDLTAQWTIVWRIPEAFGSECVGGGCGRPWKQDATGTGSITGSRSPEENCSGSLHSNSDFLANRLTGDQIQFIAKSPMEYGGELQTAGSCPASGGYLLEGTGLARTRPESLKLIRSTFGVPLVTRVGGGPGPAPSFNPQSVSWSGTMTIINGTCGDVCSAPGPSTPEAVRDFARRAWRSVIPEYMLIFAFDSIEFSLLDSTPLFFSLLHVPTSVFDALSQALQAYIDGSNLFYKLYFLPIVNETFTTMINTLTALEKAFNDPRFPATAGRRPWRAWAPRRAFRRATLPPGSDTLLPPPGGERDELADCAARHREPHQCARHRRRPGERR